MDRNTELDWIRSEIRWIITKETNASLSDVKPSARLKEDLKADELKMAGIVVSLEMLLGKITGNSDLEYPDAEVDNFQTVQDIMDATEKLLGR